MEDSRQLHSKDKVPIPEFLNVEPSAGARRSPAWQRPTVRGSPKSLKSEARGGVARVNMWWLVVVVLPLAAGAEQPTSWTVVDGQPLADASERFGRTNADVRFTIPGSTIMSLRNSALPNVSSMAATPGASRPFSSGTLTILGAPAELGITSSVVDTGMKMALVPLLSTAFVDVRDVVGAAPRPAPAILVRRRATRGPPLDFYVQQA